jgi:acyl-ACP thioesterase
MNTRLVQETNFGWAVFQTALIHDQAGHHELAMSFNQWASETGKSWLYFDTEVDDREKFGIWVYPNADTRNPPCLLPTQDAVEFVLWYGV